MNHIYGSGYMYLCASRYQGDFPEKEYAFFNRGISGNTLRDLEKRWEEDVIGMKPDGFPSWWGQTMYITICG